MGQREITASTAAVDDFGEKAKTAFARAIAKEKAQHKRARTRNTRGMMAAVRMAGRTRRTATIPLTMGGHRERRVMLSGSGQMAGTSLDYFPRSMYVRLGHRVRADAWQSPSISRSAQRVSPHGRVCITPRIRS